MQFRSDGTSKQQFTRCAVSPHIKNDDYLVRSIPLKDKHRLIVDAVFVRRSGADNRHFLEHIPEIGGRCPLPAAGSACAPRLPVASVLHFPCRTRFIESAKSKWSVHNLLLQIRFQSRCEGTFEEGHTAMGILI